MPVYVNRINSQIKLFLYKHVINTPQKSPARFRAGGISPLNNAIIPKNENKRTGIGCAPAAGGTFTLKMYPKKNTRVFLCEYKQTCIRLSRGHSELPPSPLAVYGGKVVLDPKGIDIFANELGKSVQPFCPQSASFADCVHRSRIFKLQCFTRFKLRAPHARINNIKAGNWRESVSY